MYDRVFAAFLDRQLADGTALAAASDILDLLPVPEALPGLPPSRYLARFTCRGLIREASGQICPGHECQIGICFPGDYLRRAVPGLIVTWLYPSNAFHPNIRASAAAICLGRLPAGTPLVDILFQVWELWTWNTFNLRDPLDAAAAAWARVPANRAGLPLDRRPLKRRSGGSADVRHRASRP